MKQTLHTFTDDQGLVVTVQARPMTFLEHTAVIDIRADHPDNLEPQEIAIWADDIVSIIELLQKAKADSEQ